MHDEVKAEAFMVVARNFRRLLAPESLMPNSYGLGKNERDVAQRRCVNCSTDLCRDAERLRLTPLDEEQLFTGASFRQF